MSRVLRSGPCCVCALLLSILFGGSLVAATPAIAPQSSHPSKKDYALIYGTVWGPDDHPVAGVPIKIRRASDKKAKWEQVSDNNGEFAQRVPVGAQDYVIVADIKTPKGKAKPQTTAHITDDERADVSIHLSREMLPAR